MTIEFSEKERQAAKDIHDVLIELGFNGESLSEMVTVGFPNMDSEDADILDQIIIFSNGTSRGVLRAKGRAVFEILYHSNRRIYKEWSSPEKEVISSVDATLQRKGYSLQWESYDGTDIEYLSGTNHPEAFRLILRDQNESETTEVCFRYPPRCPDSNYGGSYFAFFEVLNQELLIPEGYRFMFVDSGGDMMAFTLIEEDKYRSLQDRYGNRLTVFNHQLLHDLTLRERTRKDYDPAGHLDHEETYGDPEPDGTIHLF